MRTKRVGKWQAVCAVATLCSASVALGRVTVYVDMEPNTPGVQLCTATDANAITVDLVMVIDDGVANTDPGLLSYAISVQYDDAELAATGASETLPAGFGSLTNNDTALATVGADEINSFGAFPILNGGISPGPSNTSHFVIGSIGFDVVSADNCCDDTDITPGFFLNGVDGMIFNPPGTGPSRFLDINGAIQDDGSVPEIRFIPGRLAAADCCPVFVGDLNANSVQEGGETSSFGFFFLNFLPDWPGGGAPSPLNAPSVSRAGFLFLNGGGFLQPYCCDDNVASQSNPVKWIAECNVGPAVVAIDDGPTGNVGVRDLSDSGSGTLVRIRVTPPSSSVAYVVQESVPAGSSVTNISEGGVYSEQFNMIRWPLFLDHESRTLSYQLGGGVSAGDLAGSVFVDGTEYPISGGLVQVAIAGDGDGDGDVDLADFLKFQECYTGSSASAGAGCGAFDFDNDQDIDLGDLVSFLAAMTGGR